MHALKRGWDQARVCRHTGVDPWFIAQLAELAAAEKDFTEGFRARGLVPGQVAAMKRLGYSDTQLGVLTDEENLAALSKKGPDFQRDYSRALKAKEKEIRDYRFVHGIIPGFRLVDTCGGEFEAYTPYYYSSFDGEDEAKSAPGRKVMIIGGGPNRIGQGIEFDYCCCHASYALGELGIESIMVNSNPETVSTDYDTSDRLYFEPLTLEDILHIYRSEQPEGIIVQFGGQTPLRLAGALQENGVKILGTSPDSIDRAEDRERFAEVVTRLGLRQPENGIAFTRSEAIAVADRIGYPVLVRPSYVLGGRAMSIIYDEASLVDYIRTAVQLSPEHPILVDRFLEDAVEIDVDAICDGEHVYIGAIMEHIEQAGVHSGDSACIIPTMSISAEMTHEITETTRALALELNVLGLLNIQFAIKDDTLFVIEVNPRASRTVPFVSKTTGVPLAKMAVKVMMGAKLADYGLLKTVIPPYVSVKEAVLPFKKFPGVDTLLSPEMKSTGEVMGIARHFGEAFFKAEMAAGDTLPREGTVFISINESSKTELLDEIRLLAGNGFRIIATGGTWKFLRENGIECERINKVHEGRPNIVDRVKNERIDLIINTPTGMIQKHDAYTIRQVAVRYSIPIITTVAAAKAAIHGLIEVKRGGALTVRSIQEYHQEMRTSQ
jgi:carbamoyl-phosphate synthase large subunit